MSDQEARAPRKSRVTAYAVGAITAVGVAAGVWFFVGSQEQKVSCEEIARSERLRAALGGAPPGSDCGELGSAIKRATGGTSAGRHSEDQAQAMKDVVLTVNDLTEDKSLDAGLRVPLAEALADYSADIRSMLGATGGVEYVRRSGPSEGPWTDEEGVHVAVDSRDLFQMLHTVSEDPAAYAVLRMALTEEAARELAAVPLGATDAEDPQLTAPPRINAHVLAVFDAIAVKVNGAGKNGGATDWDKKVFASLTHGAPSSPPAFDDDPAGYTTVSWIKQVKDRGADRTPETLRDQGSVLAGIWAKARGLDSTTVATLQRRVERAARTGFNDGERELG